MWSRMCKDCGHIWSSDSVYDKCPSCRFGRILSDQKGGIVYALILIVMFVGMLLFGFAVVAKAETDQEVIVLLEKLIEKGE